MIALVIGNDSVDVIDTVEAVPPRSWRLVDGGAARAPARDGISVGAQQRSPTGIGHGHGIVPVHERGHDHGIDHDHDHGHDHVDVSVEHTTIRALYGARTVSVLGGSSAGSIVPHAATGVPPPVVTPMLKPSSSGPCATGAVIHVPFFVAT